MGVPQLVPTLPTPRKYRRTSLRLTDAQRTCARLSTDPHVSLKPPAHRDAPAAPSGPPLVSPGNRPHILGALSRPLHALQVLSTQAAATTAAVIIAVPLSPRPFSQDYLPPLTCLKGPRSASSAPNTGHALGPGPLLPLHEPQRTQPPKHRPPSAEDPFLVPPPVHQPPSPRSGGDPGNHDAGAPL